MPKKKIISFYLEFFFIQKSKLIYMSCAIKYSEYIANLDKGLFVGSWHSTKPEILKSLDIQGVICIGFKPDKTVDGISYKFIELDDNPQSIDKLLYDIIPVTLPHIHDYLQDKRNFLVCCSAGRSRSITIVLTYLMKYRNLSAHEALEFVTSRRTCANPNPGFVKLLKNFEKLHSSLP